MGDIKFDKRNYRKHNEANRRLIKNSLKDLGTGRSIVIDNEGEIIAGNGVYAEAKDLNIPTRIVETDGSELIVVKRTDLQTEDLKRKQLAVMDNSTSDTSDFDLELLQEDFSIDDLNDWGIEIQFDKEKEIKDISDELTETYEVVCECNDEMEQEALFLRLSEEGIKCRILIL